MSGLSTEAQRRYAHVESLLCRDFRPPARVVELGAAPGDQIARLSHLGFVATSVDIGIASDNWSDGVAGRMEALYEAAGVQDIRWNLEEVPYPLPDCAFDAVVMTEVYEHLRDYPVRSLQEVFRILRPGGRVYFTTPNQTYLMSRVRLLRGHNTQSPIEDWIGGLPFARHAREYTFDEVGRLMRYAGLEVQSMNSRHFHIDAGRLGLAARIGKKGLDVLARRIPTLGPQIVVVAERPR